MILRKSKMHFGGHVAPLMGHTRHYQAFFGGVFWYICGFRAAREEGFLKGFCVCILWQRLVQLEKDRESSAQRHRRNWHPEPDKKQCLNPKSVPSPNWPQYDNMLNLGYSRSIYSIESCRYEVWHVGKRGPFTCSQVFFKDKSFVGAPSFFLFTVKNMHGTIFTVPSQRLGGITLDPWSGCLVLLILGSKHFRWWGTCIGNWNLWILWAPELGKTYLSQPGWLKPFAHEMGWLRATCQ